MDLLLIILHLLALKDQAQQLADIKKLEMTIKKLKKELKTAEAGKTAVEG